MLFDSPIYILSLSLVVLIYWRLGHRHQNWFLLAFSYFFYGWWDWRFLGLILISTVVDFYCANAIESTRNPTRRKLLLGISVGVNLAFLGYFKYFNFFVGSLHTALASIGINTQESLLSVVLPPGISFYTFQAIAYIADVYRKRIPAAKSMSDYALFISLFPHLIAGPIQRPDHLLPQVKKSRSFSALDFSNGIMLIISGLFRKCVVADQCAIIANGAFSGALGPPSIAVVAIGTYAFAWQIYGDFSGYSNIARGSAQLLGFHFMVNFRQPYLAISLQDFWRRWHISLSSWLRDYLYIALGGNRGSKLATYRNLLITMLLGGLWHGANWTFVVWGAIHGIGLAMARALRLGPSTDHSSGLCELWTKRILTFHLICIAWVFFRADSLPAALDFLGGLLHWNWRQEYFGAAIVIAEWGLTLLVIDIVEARRDEEFASEKSTSTVQLMVATLLLFATLIFAGNSINAFIYFAF